MSAFGKYPYFKIFLFGLIVYSQTLFFDFSYNDDDIMILHNTRLTEENINIRTAFTTDAWFRNKEIELYRPLQSISYMLDYRIAKNKPSIYHLTNLLLHILSCCLLFYFLKLLKYNDIQSLLGALILAVHFAFLHTICWIPARGDLLMTIFVLLAFVMLIKSENTGKTWFAVVHFTAFFFALLAKETAILLPVVFILLRYLIFRQKLFSKKNIFYGIVYLIVIFPYLYLRNNAISSAYTTFGLKAFIHNLPILPESFIKFLIPVNFSVMPHFKIGCTILGIILILWLAYLTIQRNLFSNRYLLGVFLFIILSLPALFYKPDFSDYGYEYLDHRIYLPGIGLIIMLLEIFAYYKISEKKYFKVCAFTFFILTASTTIVLSRSYKGPMEYYNQAVKSNSKSALAHANRGNILKDKNQLENALQDYTKAIELKPDFYQAFRNRGQLYETLNNNSLALADLKKANQLKPNQSEALLRLASVENKTRNYGEALSNLNILLSNDNMNTSAYLERGNTYKYLKNFDAALKDYSKAIQLDPDFKEAWLTRGVLLGGLGRFQESINDLTVFLSKVPNHGFALYFRGIANLELKNFKQACNDLSKAGNLGVTKAQDYLNRFCRN